MDEKEKIETTFDEATEVEETFNDDDSVEVEETAEDILEEFEKLFLKMLLESDEEDLSYIGDIKVNVDAAEELGSRKVSRAARLAGVEAPGAVYAFIDVNPLVEYYAEVQTKEEHLDGGENDE